MVRTWVYHSGLPFCSSATLHIGYRDAGYAYLNLDDCWQSYQRTPDGYIIVDNDAFPNGINHVADYVHGRGRLGPSRTNKTVNRLTLFG